MRVLIDYRPALRNRTGVGEYTHELVKALMAEPEGGRRLDLTLFSSSWKDRLTLAPELASLRTVDRRIPVSALNLMWHRLEWPPAEMLARARFDVTHSMHPLILPSRHAAAVVTIHDLDFLMHPERTRAEIRRDYGSLVLDHARRADHVIAVSRFTARLVEQHLSVPPARISVCSPGAPAWSPRASAPDRGYVLFLGTLEPRKNIGWLLDAYEMLLSDPAAHGLATPAAGAIQADVTAIPELLLAGGASPEAQPWLDRISRPPLAGHVRHIGYVDPLDRRSLYEGARLLVQPSFDEGFGIPVLEAMTLGVPVVAANRGALPEVAGDAALLVDGNDAAPLANAVARMLGNPSVAASCTARGLARARHYQWAETARRVEEAYALALEHRLRRTGQERCASA